MQNLDGGDSPESNIPSERSASISEIIMEFSEAFAFVRSRWSRYAEEVHPELRGAGMLVLQLVLRKGPVTATGITQMLDMDKALVSRQITKLRELGFVLAEPAPEDRRVMLLTANDEARELIAAIRRRSSHAYHARFSDWSDDDLAQLSHVLHRFNASTEDVPADGPAVRCARGHGGGAAEPGK